jgi:hypothetical protein
MHTDLFQVPIPCRPQKTFTVFVLEIPEDIPEEDIRHSLHKFRSIVEVTRLPKDSGTGSAATEKCSSTNPGAGEPKAKFILFLTCHEGISPLPLQSMQELGFLQGQFPGVSTRSSLPPASNTHFRKAYRGVDLQLHSFRTSELHGGEWPASRPSRFFPEERTAGSHWREG